MAYHTPDHHLDPVAGASATLTQPRSVHSATLWLVYLIESSAEYLWWQMRVGESGLASIPEVTTIDK